jgi:hypothetical protein
VVSLAPAGACACVLLIDAEGGGRAQVTAGICRHTTAGDARGN